MKEKDISKVLDLAGSIDIDKETVDNLKNKAKEKGVMEKAEALEEEYAPKFQKFLEDNKNLSNLNNEEKAKLIFEYKQRLSEKEKKQFDKILSMLKTYVKTKR